MRRRLPVRIKFSGHHTPNVRVDGSIQQLHPNSNGFIPISENLSVTLKSFDKLLSVKPNTGYDETREQLPLKTPEKDETEIQDVTVSLTVAK